MAAIDWMMNWSKTRQPWFILFLCSFSLVCSALIFQHVYDYLPCIKCIYQRTAMIGIAIAAAIPLIKMHWSTRLIGLALWLYSAAMGLIIANEHIEVIFSDNIFMAPCPIVPNFPDFLPLHDILPTIFDGMGDCADNSWQFLSMGMAEWMRVIFAMFLAVGVLVSMVYAIRFRQVAK